MKNLTGVTKWAMLAMYSRHARVKRWRQIWKVDPTYIVNHYRRSGDQCYLILRRLNSLKAVRT